MSAQRQFETRVLGILNDSSDFVRWRIEIASNEPQEVYFRCAGADLSPNPEALLCLSVPPSMLTPDATVFLDGEISRRLLNAIDDIQSIYSAWYPEMHRVNVVGPESVDQSEHDSNRVGIFFSGGVDSLYTLIENQAEITDIIFVHGFDIGLHQKRLRQNVSARMQTIAERFGKNLIEIETNVRELFDGLDWGRVAHGPAIAAVAHLLSPGLSKVFIPASYRYAELFPWGTHPLLDHLWSSEILEFVHDGCGMSRPEKIERIKDCEIVLDHLRVCYLNTGEAYNCGHCEKCLRTMVGLEIHGALEQCKTFPDDVDLDALSKLAIVGGVSRIFLLQNLEAVEQQNGHAELAEVLRKLASGPGLGYKIGWRFRRLINRTGV